MSPGLDDKALLDWNALMCSAFAKAYSALQNPEYKTAAVNCLSFIKNKLSQENSAKFFHTYKSGSAQYDAFLDDYAFLTEALLDVYEITFDVSYIEWANRNIEYVIANFLDDADNLFYFTASDQNDIPLRRKDLYDSATPSGNSTMVRNLQRIGILLENEAYRKLATDMLLNMKASVVKYPNSFGRWASALLNETNGIPEVAVIGEEAFDMSKQIFEAYLPQIALMASQELDNNYPLLKNKESESDTLVYICQNYSCQQPVKTVEEFAQLVREL